MNRYYVYQHVDNDGTIVYVGMGSGARVWRTEGRDKEHKAWMLSKMPSNFKWIIIQENLSQKEAFALELSLIKEKDYLFNRYKKGEDHPLHGFIGYRRRKVINEDTGEVFDSIKLAAKAYNISDVTLGNFIRGTATDQQKSAGCKWRFYESK